MPKIRPEQLTTSLKKSILPVYLVTGDEALLVQEACDTIRKVAKTAGFGERELYHSEANFDWQLLSQNLNSLSLFSDKKIVEVRVNSGKIDAKASEVIREFCTQAPEDTLLLLVLPKIDKRAQNTAWYKAIESSGASITVWPVSAEQLPRWVEQRLSAAGLRADSSAIDILCTKIEGNLLAAVQEIEKLKLLAENGLISSELMTNVVMDSARFNIFGLLDKALAGDSRSAIATLHGLKAEGVQPLTLLWALTREIRTLTSIREAVDKGDSFDFAAKRNGVWENRKSLIRRAVQNKSLMQLHILLRLAAQADRTVKGMAQGDEWNIILDICLGLAGVETLSKKTRKMALAC